MVLQLHRPIISLVIPIKITTFLPITCPFLTPLKIQAASLPLFGTIWIAYEFLARPGRRFPVLITGFGTICTDEAGGVFLHVGGALGRGFFEEAVFYVCGGVGGA